MWMEFWTNCIMVGFSWFLLIWIKCDRDLYSADFHLWIWYLSCPALIGDGEQQTFIECSRHILYCASQTTVLFFQFRPWFGDYFDTGFGKVFSQNVPFFSLYTGKYSGDETVHFSKAGAALAMAYWLIWYWEQICHKQIAKKTNYF